AAPDDVGGAGRMFRGRDADNRTILGLPDIRIAVPIFERLTIEDLCPAVMVIKVDRLRLHKMESRWVARLGSRLLRAHSSGKHPDSKSRRQSSRTQKAFPGKAVPTKRCKRHISSVEHACRSGGRYFLPVLGSCRFEYSVGYIVRG